MHAIGSDAGHVLSVLTLKVEAWGGVTSHWGACWQQLCPVPMLQAAPWQGREGFCYLLCSFQDGLGPGSGPPWAPDATCSELA